MASNDFAREIEEKRQRVLHKISQLPVAVLIWGPSPEDETPVGNTRTALRDALLEDGHLAHFSEELYDESINHSNFAQQIAQAESYDLVVSIPATPGSIAEIHDFARLPGVGNNIIAMLDEQWNDGYSNNSLIQLESNATCRIHMYKSGELPICVIDAVRSIVGRLQELHYALGRRC